MTYVRELQRILSQHRIDVIILFAAIAPVAALQKRHHVVLFSKFQQQPGFSEGTVVGGDQKGHVGQAA